MSVGIEGDAETEAKGVGEQSALAIGGDLQRRPESQAGGSFGGELFAPEPIGVESTEARENDQGEHPWQTLHRRLGQKLSPTPYLHLICVCACPAPLSRVMNTDLCGVQPWRIFTPIGDTYGTPTEHVVSFSKV